jgi:hypothetical protein
MTIGSPNRTTPVQLGEPAGERQPTVKAPPSSIGFGEPTAQVLAVSFQLDDHPRGLHGASI